jgi:uncharacterized protein with HEPN domain
MRNYRVYLSDILDCINRIERYIKGISYSEFVNIVIGGDEACLPKTVR